MRELSRDTDPLDLPFDDLLDLTWSLFSIVEEPSICFIAFIWTRRLTALSIIASIRSSIPMSCSIASSVNKTEAEGLTQFSIGPKGVAAGNKFDFISC